jgi:hypothetical protein
MKSSWAISRVNWLNTIYWTLFTVKHNNKYINSLTFRCASLSVLVIQFLLHVSVYRTILRQYIKHLTLLNWAYIWIHIYLQFCCMHRLCFVCNVLNKYMNLLRLKYYIKWLKYIKILKLYCLKMVLWTETGSKKLYNQYTQWCTSICEWVNWYLCCCVWW